MMTSLSGTVSRMLREVMFASGVWYCIYFCVSQAVGKLDILLAVMVCHLRARNKSMIRTTVVHKLFFCFLDHLPEKFVVQRVLRDEYSKVWSVRNRGLGAACLDF